MKHLTLFSALPLDAAGCRRARARTSPAPKRSRNSAPRQKTVSQDPEMPELPLESDRAEASPHHETYSSS